MKIKGYNARKSQTIAMRSPIPGRDVDADGENLESGFVAFVQIADCEIVTVEVDGLEKKYYKPETAKKNIPITYFGTYYGCGALRLNSTGKWFKDIKGHVFDNEYFTLPMYFAYKGNVYTATRYIRLAEVSEGTYNKLSDKLKSKVDEAREKEVYRQIESETSESY